MAKIVTELNKLRDTDIYSLILFALYKAKDIPEYSSLSELVYVLDRENLLKLCEYFGGQTITIPTIKDLERLVFALIVFQYVNIDGMTYEEASKKVGYDSTELRQAKADYEKLSVILKSYDFTARR